MSTAGTHKLLRRSGVPCEMVYKIADGARPNVLDIVKNRKVHLVINTPSGRGARTDEGRIRGAASRGVHEKSRRNRLKQDREYTSNGHGLRHG